MSDAFYSDADIEMIELAAAAAEMEADTCPRCGVVDQWVTLKSPARDDRTEAYECVCGYIQCWANGRLVAV